MMLATPIAAPGGAIALEGLLDGDSRVFDRPDELCGGAVPGVRFEAFRVVNQTGAPQLLDIEALWGAGDVDPDRARRAALSCRRLRGLHGRGSGDRT